MGRAEAGASSGKGATLGLVTTGTRRSWKQSSSCDLLAWLAVPAGVGSRLLSGHLRRLQGAILLQAGAAHPAEGGWRAAVPAPLPTCQRLCLLFPSRISPSPNVAGLAAPVQHVCREGKSWPKWRRSGAPGEGGRSGRRRALWVVFVPGQRGRGGRWAARGRGPSW